MQVDKGLLPFDWNTILEIENEFIANIKKSCLQYNVSIEELQLGRTSATKKAQLITRNINY